MCNLAKLMIHLLIMVRIRQETNTPYAHTLLPPAYECFQSIHTRRERVPHLHPIILPLVPCPFWGVSQWPVQGPFPDGVSPGQVRMEYLPDQRWGTPLPGQVTLGQVMPWAYSTPLAVSRRTFLFFMWINVMCPVYLYLYLWKGAVIIAIFIYWPRGALWTKTRFLSGTYRYDEMNCVDKKIWGCASECCEGCIYFGQLVHLAM